MSGPPRTLREDVHIHAPAADVYARLTEPTAEWWPPAVSDLRSGQGSLAFTLGLPGRSEHADLVRATEEAPRFLEFGGTNGSAVHGLTWVVNDEGPREVHLIVELVYQPADGALGWMLEETLQRPSRRQVLRDALWRLKLLLEGQR